MTSILAAFGLHVKLRAVLDAGLEGRLGELHSDPEGACHRLDVGAYAFFAGDGTHSAAAGLVASVPAPRELVFGTAPAWAELARSLFGARLRPQPMQAYRGDELDPARLRDMAGAIGAPYVVVPFDRALAEQLGEELRPHALATYGTPERFATEGFGVAAVDGGRLACAATSYAVCSHGVEIAISTHPEHRRRGLAKGVAARMCLEVLARGMEPHWNASNPFSQKLALELGFRDVGEVAIEYLAEG